MKVTLIVGFLACLGAALAQEEPRCCIPDQWEGNWGAQEGWSSKRTGRSGSIGVMVKLSYDAKAKKLATKGGAFGANNTEFRTIVDYTTHKLYYIHGDSCKVMPYKRPFRKACFPNKKAHYVGPAYFGTGNDKLNFNSYTVQLRKRRMSVNMFVSLTKSCVPIGNSGSGMAKGVGFMYAGGYTDITAGIKNRRVFVPPKTCKAVDDMEDLELHHHLLTTLTEDLEDHDDVNNSVP